MLEQEPAVDQVIAGGLVPVADTRFPEFDVADAFAVRGLPGQREFHHVHVDADDPAGRTGQAREVEGDLAAAASEVDAVKAGSDAGPAEQVSRIGPVHPGQYLQPLVSRLATAQDVPFHLAMGEPGATGL